MDKITFEEYCEYTDKGLIVDVMFKPYDLEGLKIIVCDSEKELYKMSELIDIYSQCYSAIKSHPKEKDVVMEALRKYLKTGETFGICYKDWEEPESPPEDIKFIIIHWGV